MKVTRRRHQMTKKGGIKNSFLELFSSGFDNVMNHDHLRHSILHLINPPSSFPPYSSVGDSPKN